MSNAAGNSAPTPGAKGAPRVGGAYANYVVGVLSIVYVFNFIDRNIISILAQDIKADLGLTDSQLGFLYGTAFAVFYAVFGIPLGRLADVWVRKNLIAIGLAFWSLMTALSGLARSFAALGAYRIGVGVGESSATPAAFSMLGDWFPPRLRATALALYSSGVYVGAGLGILLGGWVVDGWNELYPQNPPLGLAGWHIAFFVVGLPGLLMAFWVWSLREPLRGMSEGLPEAAPHPHPFREFAAELTAVLPPLTVFSLARRGGASAAAINLAMAAGLVVVSAGLIELLGDPEQWVALAIGVYSAASWIQGLRLRDRAAFEMIFRSRAMLLLCTGYASFAFVTYGFSFWAPSFFELVHGKSKSEIGTMLGLGAALGGLIGVNLGGWLSDRMKQHLRNARLWVGCIALALTLPAGLGLLLTQNLALAYVLFFVFSVVSPLWLGSAASAVNELVMPRMRALASAFYLLLVTFIGLALGPYTMGSISDTLHTAGAGEGEALRSAMLASFVIFLPAAALLALATRYLPSEEANRLARARSAGESV
ncbi:MAG: MFS transporter [Deltaproteobacteria bacterium]|nr:MFS transporter [Deltaproteobacteria bacterium]